MIKHFFWILFLPTLALAKHPVLSNTVNIQSDTLTYNQVTQEAVHEGNVVLTQGDYILFADKLILHKGSTQSKQIEKIIATGNPAKFEAKPKKDKMPVLGEAKTIYYYPTTQQLILQNQAKLHYQADIFTAPKITYDIQKNIIFSEKRDQERSSMVIHPTKPTAQGVG
ncbi:MAG TPA: lipopolysaccharide transport periplasmic protein LptA [Gammaproteobacteria bacterium]|nr:lipopolysaccharide transport periplasmic protein LptA [Gammaproteobacteria bacterium]